MEGLPTCVHALGASLTGTYSLPAFLAWLMVQGNVFTIAHRNGRLSCRQVLLFVVVFVTHFPFGTVSGDSGLAASSPPARCSRMANTQRASGACIKGDCTAPLPIIMTACLVALMMPSMEYPGAGKVFINHGKKGQSMAFRM